MVAKLNVDLLTLVVLKFSMTSILDLRLLSEFDVAGMHANFFDYKKSSTF